MVFINALVNIVFSPLLMGFSNFCFFRYSFHHNPSVLYCVSFPNKRKSIPNNIIILYKPDVCHVCSSAVPIFVLFLTPSLNRCSCWFFVRICVQSFWLNINNTKRTSLIQSSQKSLFSHGTYTIRDTNKVNEFCIAHLVRQTISIWFEKLTWAVTYIIMCLKYKVIFFNNFCQIWPLLIYLYYDKNTDTRQDLIDVADFRHTSFNTVQSI